VFLPETYLVPQAIGGVLFGVGFLIGGLCPGTSCVAAAAGRVDGLAVIAGMLLGVFAFNLSFDAIASFYESTPMGAITLPQLLGVPTGMVIAAVTVAALAGFAVTSRIERSRS
jgi:uncharacterized membrane protein YedE/YeeE